MTGGLINIIREISITCILKLNYILIIIDHKERKIIIPTLESNRIYSNPVCALICLVYKRG